MYGLACSCHMCGGAAAEAPHNGVIGGILPGLRDEIIIRRPQVRDQQLHAGDGIIFYSPRLSYPDGEPCQRFTALGAVTTGEVYQRAMGEGFMPYRLDITYLPCHEVPIQPLIAQLSFIKDKTRWGAAFRFGSLRVLAQDFAIIAQQMGCDVSQTFS